MSDLAELEDFLVARIPEPEWRERALCGREDMAAYFPRGRPSDRAKERCLDCPVRAECREYALDSDWEPYGIWGGMTSSELKPEWAARHS